MEQPAGALRAVRAALHDSLGRAVVGCHVSHLYPTGASLYFTVLAAADTGREAEQWLRAKQAANDAIVAAGGTITHHHAVGTAHRDHVAAELGEVGVDALRAVKERLDPAGILNPGKAHPDGMMPPSPVPPPGPVEADTSVVVVTDGVGVGVGVADVVVGVGVGVGEVVVGEGDGEGEGDASSSSTSAASMMATAREPETSPLACSCLTNDFSWATAAFSSG